ncbi:MAG: DUF3570 domain-containing protein [Myxococcales bacterium]|nr:DUF3570 domain-containing protein [Myxococcales bacterium]
MRLQLALAAILALAPLGAARADGTITARGVYYKERATRVMQPMLDAMLDVGSRGIVTGHFLVDAITSASASSGAENAMAFTETRYEGGLGYTHELGRVFGDGVVDALRVGVEGKYSSESDYRSLYAGARTEIDVAQKNTTIGLGVGISKDRISAASAQGPSMPTLECESGQALTECDLSVYALFASASQILSKNMILGVSYDFASLDGYQSNPYRTALADDGVAPERHPTTRRRTAVAASLRYYYPRSQTTFIGSYRYYQDNWKVFAHTPELRIVQQVGHAADASLRYRFYVQDRAFFYRDRYATIDPGTFPFLSDDPKLDDFTTHTFEAKLGVIGDAFGVGGRWSEARFEGILSYVAQGNRFGNAIIGHVALTVPLDY